MADVIKEVISFDVDAKAALAATNNLVKTLKSLDKEYATLQKQGKDTTDVQARISQATKQLDAQLSQATNTVKGQTAQLKALNSAADKLAVSTNKAANTQTNLAKASKTAATSIARSAGSIKSFGGIVALGAANLGNFLGIANLGGFAISSLTNVADKAALAFLNWLSPINEVLETSKELAVTFAAESQAAKGVFDSALLATQGTEARAAGIAAINEQYGAYLPNLLTEKSSNEEIAASYALVNEAILQNIIVKAKAEKQQEAINKIVTAQIALASSRRVIDTAAAKRAIADGEKEFKRLDSVFSQVESNLRNSQSKFTTANVQSELSKSQQALDLVEKAYKDGRISQDLYQTSVDGLTKRINGLTAANKANNKETKTAAKTAKEVKDEYTILENSLSGLESELSKIGKFINEQIDVNDIGRVRAYQEEYDALALKIEEAKKAINGIKPAPIKLIDVQEIDVIQNAQQEVEKLNIAQINATKDLEIERNKALQAAGNDAQKQLQINEQFNQRRAALELKATQDILRTRLRVLQLQKTSAQLAGEDIGKLEQEIAQINLDLAELSNKQITIDANTQPAEKKISKVKDTILAVVDGLQNLSQQVTDFLQQNTQRTIAQYDAAIQKQEEAIQTLLNNQNAANTQQVQQEQARLDALNKARQRAKERESAIIIAQIAANAALTIARAAAEGGGIASAFTIAAALASLAFGFASARQQAAQSFYEGTTFLDDPNAPRGRDTIKVNAHRGEAIIPSATNARYKSAIEAIYHQNIPAEVMNSFVANYKSGEFASGYTGFNLIEVPKKEGFSKNQFRRMESLLATLVEKSGTVVNVSANGSSIDVERRKRKF